ncbi:hypothetical protein WAX74_12870 [Psychrobacillus sp. FJAT-51614]|uniref:RNA-binding protein n=1 Tax=Psychrobacillus mangrovi TaxID=3117745 RepID=A0ABU8F6Y2_9BACI
MDNGSIVKGTIVFVGSNFVEILVDEPLALDEGEQVVEDVEIVADETAAELTAEVDLDKELTHKPPVEENKLDEGEKREHVKGKTWIFSIDKIVKVKLSNSN